jgi:predicted dehydrogenase
VFFELREAAAMVSAKQLVSGGAIGEVRALRIQTVINKPQNYWASGPSGYTVDNWRARMEQAGGGVVLMNSIHQLDGVRHITGLDVLRVCGDVGTLVASVEVEDTGSATLRYSNGAIGTLAASATVLGHSCKSGSSSTERRGGWTCPIRTARLGEVVPGAGLERPPRRPLD